MFHLFHKSCLTTLFAVVSLSAINLSLNAYDCCEQYECCEPQSTNRLYIGAFGGGIYSESSKISQFGTAYFPEIVFGPLSIIGEGRLNRTSTGFGGVQVGYEWSKPSSSGWSLATAGEFEAYYFEGKKRGHLINQTVNGLPEHEFQDSFHMNSAVVLANVVFSLKTDSLFGLTPYVGGGIGATRICLNKADSLQVEPLEVGINHFNSRRSDSSWAFAAQAKAGLRFDFCQMFHIFGEYRYLFVDTSNYIFGATNYTTHVPTSPWNVRLRDANFNAFAVGIQFDL
jgi:opacity protein-like surface antigen